MRSTGFLSYLNVGLLVLGATVCASAREKPRDESLLFPEEGFEDAIRFWTEVFATHGENDFVLHDSEDLRLVYRVVSAAQVDESHRRDFLARQKKEMAEILRQIGDSPSSLSPEQVRIRAVLRVLNRPITPRLCEKLAGRLRYQRGIRERFRAGLVRSGQYFSVIQGTLREKGLPEDLAYLPHIESSFTYTARSKAGAAGIWQLMPAAARPQLHISSLVDERLDPIKATRTAADILKTNFEMLGSWPLAITAYNHGRNGMARARAQCGDNLREIIKSYRSPAFGFASRNFYAEFLAARRIARAPERHFGRTPPGPPLRYRTIRLDRRVSVSSLSATSGIAAEKLREYNPHVLPRAWTGKLALPTGLEIKLPETASLIAQAADSGGSQTGAQTRTYTVRSGDTLTRIATRTGISVKQIREANRLRGDLLHPGQVLELESAADPSRQYRVEKGDTLVAIARRLGSSVTKIQEVNQLVDPHKLVLGQVLLIP